MLSNRSWLPVLLAFAAAGCSQPVGTVSGRVTFDGKPLATGSNTVAFHGPNGEVNSCLVEADGRYTLRNVPVGATRITVVALPPPPQMPVSLGTDGKIKVNDAEGVGTRKRGYLGIPERYRDADRSGLTHEVAPGEQTFDITLVP